MPRGELRKVDIFDRKRERKHGIQSLE